MNTGINCYRLVNSPMFAYIPPDENTIRGHMEYMKEKGNKAPRRRPGDKFTIFGALVGTILGIILGSRTSSP
ncbi:hypothetical protein ACFLVU_01240 [Chloroflexota bacterium]